jgi:hypothetical protein
MRTIIPVIILTLGLQPLLKGQSQGRINGTVTDPSGATIPGATVIATQAGSGLRRDAIAGTSGNYTLADLPIGIYDLTAEAPGFAITRATGVRLTVAATVLLDFRLSVAGAAEKVEVSAQTLRRSRSTAATMAGFRCCPRAQWRAAPRWAISRLTASIPVTTISRWTALTFRVAINRPPQTASAAVRVC